MAAQWQSAATALPAGGDKLALAHWSPPPHNRPASVLARGATLVVEGIGPIAEAPDRSWRYADPEMVSERVWFDTPLTRRMPRASLSGADMWRFNDGQSASGRAGLSPAPIHFRSSSRRRLLST